jgi:hypothetical protein
LIGIRRVGPEVVDHGVVKAQHRDVELADYDIFVVPAVAQNGVIVGITW